MNTGLESKIMEKIKAIVKNNPKISNVILFGSRAKGVARDGSDIDLAVVGNSINFRDICLLGTKFDELDLPYKIDLVDYNHIVNKDLKEHIDRVGIVL